MKKMFVLAAAAILLGILSLPAAADWIYMAPRSSTGFNMYSYTAGVSGFSGTAGFFVRVDSAATSLFLLDNLSQCSIQTNNSFELGDLRGYTTGGAYVMAGYEGSTLLAFAPWGTESSCYFSVPDGTHVAIMAGGAGGDPPIKLANAFGNTTGIYGSGYAYLETAISLTPGQTFTFEWGFITSTSGIAQDFCKFYLIDDSGVVFEDGLAQLNNPPPVPLPPTVLLLGSGLLGLLGVGRRPKRS